MGGLVGGFPGRGVPNQGLGRDFWDAQAICHPQDHVSSKASSFRMGSLGVCVVKAIIADDAQRRGRGPLDAHRQGPVGAEGSMSVTQRA